MSQTFPGSMDWNLIDILSDSYKFLTVAAASNTTNIILLFIVRLRLYDSVQGTYPVIADS
jgi:hypothetical protein